MKIEKIEKKNMFSSCCGCANKKSKEKIIENSDNKQENIVVHTNDEKDDNLNENIESDSAETGNNKEETIIKDDEACHNELNGKLENGICF